MRGLLRFILGLLFAAAALFLMEVATAQDGLHWAMDLILSGICAAITALLWFPGTKEGRFHVDQHHDSDPWG